MEPDFEKLRDAAAVLDGIPEERFSAELLMFTEHTTGTVIGCDTLACGAGWLALHGGFGFSVPDEDAGFWPLLSSAFNLDKNQVQDIFTYRGCGNYDRTFKGTDKALLRHRIVSFLKEHGQPVCDEKGSS